MQPNSTQFNPIQPKSTQVIPSQPKSTQVNPIQPNSYLTKLSKVALLNILCAANNMNYIIPNSEINKTEISGNVPNV